MRSIHIPTLFAITLEAASLIGCDDGLPDSDGIDETGAESGTGVDTGDDTADGAVLEAPADDDEPAPFAPTAPTSAERLDTTPEDEPMMIASINLALGKPASQSSTYSPASLAVDGNRDGNYDHGSVAHTNNDGDSWWQVDLQEVQSVGEVVISNRTDCCSERLHDFTVEVSTDGVTWEGFPFAGVAGARAHVLIDRPARWVKIINPGVLNIAEVEVLRTRSLAHGKPTSQSSTTWGGDPARAVDGNTDGNYNRQSVTHTEDGLQEWWQVDLESIQAIGMVVLFNRTDCCDERLHDFKLRVSNDEQNWFDIPFLGVAGPEVVIPVNREGRFVRVENGAGPLSLAEVQIYEAPRIPGLSYGRGVGTIPSFFGCSPGEEQDGWLCYPPCAPGYDGVGPVCWRTCDPGYTDLGAFCMNFSVFGWPSYWKHSYGRGVGTPLVSACDPGMEYDAGLCYQQCAPGYNGVGPICWSEGISIASIAEEACGLMRVPFMSSLAGSIGGALTAGVGLGVAAYATASAELGVAYGPAGEFGCYVTGCAGLTTGGVSISAFVTAGLYDTFGDIAGASTVTSAGAALGIPETPISIGGTLGEVHNQKGVVGATASVSVNVSQPSPINFAASGLACDTALLPVQ